MSYDDCLNWMLIAFSMTRSTAFEHQAMLDLITARRYASAVYAVVVCPSVRLSVRPSIRPSQAGTVPKRLNVGSR